MAQEPYHHNELRGIEQAERDNGQTITTYPGTRPGGSMRRKPTTVRVRIIGASQVGGHWPGTVVAYDEGAAAWLVERGYAEPLTAEEEAEFTTPPTRGR